MELPTIGLPEMQMPKPNMPEMPSMPEFTVPKFEAPKLFKQKPPERAQQKTTPILPWADTNVNTKNQKSNAKTNYSPLQASWKETKPNNTPTPMELPTVALPDLSSFGLSNAVPVKRYSVEARRLSRQIDTSIKEKVNGFTGQSSYEVGDISKAIIAKVANEEFELAEITFFFRILIAAGVDLSGFSAVLPVSGLVGVLGWSVSMGVAERVAQYVTVEINKRVNGNEDGSVADATIIDVESSPVRPDQYNPGDLTKSALLGYTGKSSYAVGDLAGTGSADGGGGSDTDRNASVLQELEECLSMEKALIEKLDRIQQQQQ